MIGGLVEVLFENSLRQIEIKEKMTLQDLLEELGIKETDPYWVACNRKMILRSEYDQKFLKPGYRIEILRILSGGSER
ncbi:MAG: sulfur carrier protein ThiS [Deltaproteobacteria bacterium]|nr:sulfur carrier protein ThiS [Deltaproteobacteria bacterium]MBM4323193.1 sulfur carrier protein ThiS [Deltaproteobacteria bacterium]MBM4347195.1 sulfur carrier protein ThiS [Deltaproteobacteria bacterium]